ncbi:hypothetical protein C426_0662 [Lactococcus garvieae DCC43]|uniref:Uncharacterized protein n=1 Tax=Lactococcus garvieae DCC43 TaxID=1231377 RepID=K2PK82_9LACT|nr:hypothetical protein C426_0662 [Lactococcus garvieae DCC43]
MEFLYLLSATASSLEKIGSKLTSSVILSEFLKLCKQFTEIVSGFKSQMLL